ncbi:MAG: GxxExxY protein [Bacteroidetes bacterium]|nr:GxxExxY protein [Bacteroidota bacterium]
MQFEGISKNVIGKAIEVHRHLGPGLLESAYEECLAYELEKSGFDCKRQLAVPIVYKDIKLDKGYRIDILVNDMLVIEIKSVEALNDVHEAQILTYMKFADKKIGLLLNFNVKMLRQGLKRYVR